MKFQAEPLDLLKVVVHEEDLGEDWAATATNHLCTVHLQTHIGTGVHAHAHTHAN